MNSRMKKVVGRKFVDDFGMGEFESVKKYLSSLSEEASEENDAKWYFLLLVGLMERMPHLDELTTYAKVFGDPIFLKIEQLLMVGESREFEDFDFHDGYQLKIKRFVHAEFKAARTDSGISYSVAKAFDARKSVTKGLREEHKPTARWLKRQKEKLTEEMRRGNAGPRNRSLLKMELICRISRRLDKIFERKIKKKLEEVVVMPGMRKLSRNLRRYEVIADLVNWRIGLDYFDPSGQSVPFPGYKGHDIKMMIVGRKR